MFKLIINNNYIKKYKCSNSIKKIKIKKKKIKIYYKLVQINKKYKNISNFKNKYTNNKFIIYYIQRTFKNNFICILNKNIRLITFITKKQYSFNDNIFNFIVLNLVQFYKLKNLIFFLKFNHINFFKKFNNTLKLILNNSLLKNLIFFLIKPNFFFINLQYKKIKSLKKSRKKLLYVNLKNK